MPTNLTTTSLFVLLAVAAACGAPDTEDAEPTSARPPTPGGTPPSDRVVCERWMDCGNTFTDVNGMPHGPEYCETFERDHIDAREYACLLEESCHASMTCLDGLRPACDDLARALAVSADWNGLTCNIDGQVAHDGCVEQDVHFIFFFHFEADGTFVFNTMTTTNGGASYRSGSSVGRYVVTCDGIQLTTCGVEGPTMPITFDGTHLRIGSVYRLGVDPFRVEADSRACRP